MLFRIEYSMDVLQTKRAYLFLSDGKPYVRFVSLLRDYPDDYPVCLR